MKKFSSYSTKFIEVVLNAMARFLNPGWGYSVARGPQYNETHLATDAGFAMNFQGQEQ